MSEKTKTEIHVDAPLLRTCGHDHPHPAGAIVMLEPGKPFDPEKVAHFPDVYTACLSFAVSTISARSVQAGFDSGWKAMHGSLSLSQKEISVERLALEEERKKLAQERADLERLRALPLVVRIEPFEKKIVMKTVPGGIEGTSTFASVTA
jgi:hypothetical protein